MIKGFDVYNAGGHYSYIHFCWVDEYVIVYAFPLLSETFMYIKSADELLMNVPMENVELSPKYTVYVYIKMHISDIYIPVIHVWR